MDAILRFHSSHPHNVLKERLESKELKVSKDQPALLDPKVHKALLEFQECKDPKESKDHWDQQALTDSQDPQDPLDLSEDQELLVSLDPKEREDPLDLKDSKVNKEHQVSLDLLVSKETPELKV